MCCGLCSHLYDTDTCQHLHQRIDEQKYTIIGKHTRKLHYEIQIKMKKVFQFIKNAVEA